MTKPSWSRVAAAFVWQEENQFQPGLCRAGCRHQGSAQRYLARQLYDYDLGYFDLETRVPEPPENPFGPKVLPMS